MSLASTIVLGRGPSGALVELRVDDDGTIPVVPYAAATTPATRLGRVTSGYEGIGVAVVDVAVETDGRLSLVLGDDA